MTTFIGAAQSPRHGQYLIDGVKYPRVSTILGMVPKPGLARWREREIREGRDPDAQAREAAERGTAVHALTEAIDKDQLTAVPDALLPFVLAYMDWKSEYVWSMELIERVVVHKRHGYAGQLDRVVILNEPERRRALVDIKTGRSVDAVTRLQTTAYVLALEDEMSPDIDLRLVVHMPWDRPGLLKMIPYDNDEADRRWWRRTLGSWKRYQQVKDEWRGTRA
jgi:hypothetical protein